MAGEVHAQGLEVVSEAGLVSVEWDAIPGVAYRLQSRPGFDLASGWANVNPVGDGWLYALGDRVSYQVHAFEQGGASEPSIAVPPSSSPTFAITEYVARGKYLVSWGGDSGGQVLLESDALPSGLPALFAAQVPDGQGAFYALTLVRVGVSWQDGFLTDASLVEATLPADQKLELDKLTGAKTEIEAALGTGNVGTQGGGAEQPGDAYIFRLETSYPDSDADGMLDWEEFALSMDAFHPDSDRDGVLDVGEIAAGSDPSDPASVPAGIVGFEDRLQEAVIKLYDDPSSLRIVALFEGRQWSVVPDIPGPTSPPHVTRPFSRGVEYRFDLNVTSGGKAQMALDPKNGEEWNWWLQIGPDGPPSGGHTQTVPVSVPISTMVTATLVPVEIVTETEAALPDDRTRKTIGVGEVVNLTLEITGELPAGTTWSWALEPAAGAGELEENATNPKKAKYLAPAVAATPKIEVAFSTGRSVSVNFQVIEPTGIAFATEGREDHDLYNNGAANPGKAIGMKLHPAFFLLPDTVNFDNLRTYEGFAAPIRTGYFLQSAYPDHDANGPHEKVRYRDGEGNLGNARENPDNAFDRFQVTTDGPFHGDGEIRWTCDWDYEVFRDDLVVGERKTFASAAMVLELEKTGTNIVATIRKGEAEYSHTFTVGELGE